MNTAQEIAYGSELNTQVDDESVLVQDRFLISWVDNVRARLAEHRFRKDITYRFEIVDSNEINSFALPGGFIHVDMGLLNFVSSDDELASVMGHEMGHVERRHVVTLAQKAKLLNVLVGVLSAISPIGYALSGYGGDLAFNKFSRQDELQADQYGLLLMTQAGYDPQSIVDTMSRLASMQGASESRTDKYFQSHPDPQARVSHLLGYPELSHANADQLIAQGIHDQQEGRYNYARAKFNDALKRSGGSLLLSRHLAQADIALRDSGARAAAGGRSETAASSIPDESSRSSAAFELAAAASVTRNDASIVKNRAKSARREIENFFSQLQSLSQTVANLGRPKKKGNNLSVALEGLNRLTRDINGTLDLTSDVAGTSVGLLAENEATIKSMADPLRDGPLTPRTEALLPFYPFMAADITRSSDALVRSVDDSRAAVGMGSEAVHVFADYLNILGAQDTTSGDISASEMPQVRAALDRAVSAWDATQARAMQSSNEMYGAQTRNLSTEISLLDLTSSAQRYDAYRRAINHRFPGVEAPDYQTTVRLGLLPGEVGCDAWLAYDSKAPIADVIAQTRADGTSCVDLALKRHLFSESMEIAEGLLYENYIDKPQKQG